MDVINVLLADDHQLVLDGFNSLLETEEDIHVVASVNNGKEALKFIRRNRVDVAILDIEMPGMNGIEAAKKIIALNKNVKVLILSMYNNVRLIKTLIDYGGSGYILKNRGHEELLRAIYEVYKGNVFFGDEVNKTLIKGLREPSKILNNAEKLTKREVEVLRLIGKGHSTPQIAVILNIAKTTIETHRRNLIEKLGASSTKDLIIYALKNEFVN